MTPRGAVCTCAGGLMGLPAAHRGTCQTDGTNVRVYFQPVTESPVAVARTGGPTKSPTTAPTRAPADSDRAASATGDGDDDAFEWWWIVIGVLLFLAVLVAFLVMKRGKEAEGAGSRAAPGFMNMVRQLRYRLWTMFCNYLSSTAPPPPPPIPRTRVM